MESPIKKIDKNLLQACFFFIINYPEYYMVQKFRQLPLTEGLKSLTTIENKNNKKTRKVRDS